MASNTEEGQGRDILDLASKLPTRLAHLRTHNAGDITLTNEDENSDACVLSKNKMSSLNAKQTLLYAAINRSKQVEERNTVLHNKLERMRRKVMRQLFAHLQRIIVKIPRNALITDTVTHAKKTVLCAVSEVRKCMLGIGVGFAFCCLHHDLP